MLDMFQREPGNEDGGGPQEPGLLDAETIAGLLGFFPIGRKLRFCPVEQRDTLLESLVLGYSIDGVSVFRGDEVSASGAQGELLIDRAEGNPVRITPRESFCIVLPNDVDGLDELDYVRLSELDRSGLFAVGNRITLISAGQKEGAPVVEAEVRHLHTLRTGVYANQPVVELQIIPGSLQFTEQRKRYRLRTELPVLMRTIAGTDLHPCLLADFSEIAARVEFDAGSELARAMHVGRRMMLFIDLPEFDLEFRLETLVQSIEDGVAIVSMLRMQQGEQMEDLSNMDALFIKATLLKLPAG